MSRRKALVKGRKGGLGSGIEFESLRDYPPTNFILPQIDDALRLKYTFIFANAMVGVLLTIIQVSIALCAHHHSHH